MKQITRYLLASILVGCAGSNGGHNEPITIGNGQIEGIVVFEDAPALSPGDGRPIYDERKPAVDARVTLVAREKAPQSTVSDSLGRFNFDVPQGEYILVAEKFGSDGTAYAQFSRLVVVADSTVSQDLELVRAARLEGTIRLASAQGDNAGAIAILPELGLYGVSNTDGSYLVSAIPPGTHRVDFMANGHKTRADELQFLEGATVIKDVELAVDPQYAPEAHIIGTVTRAQDADPIARALVQSVDRRFIAVTDNNGSFSLGVDAGSRLVFATAGGYEPSVAQNVEVAAGKSSVADFALEGLGLDADRLATLTLLFATAAQAGVSGVQVMIDDSSYASSSTGDVSVSLAAGCYEYNWVYNDDSGNDVVCLEWGQTLTRQIEVEIVAGVEPSPICFTSSVNSWNPVADVSHFADFTVTNYAPYSSGQIGTLLPGNPIVDANSFAINGVAQTEVATWNYIYYALPVSLTGDFALDATVSWTGSFLTDIQNVGVDLRHAQHGSLATAVMTDSWCCETGAVGAEVFSESYVSTYNRSAKYTAPATGKAWITISRAGGLLTSYITALDGAAAPTAPSMTASVLNRYPVETVNLAFGVRDTSANGYGTLSIEGLNLRERISTPTTICE